MRPRWVRSGTSWVKVKRPRRPHWAKRALSYAFLIFFYFYFGVEGSLGTGPVADLMIGISGGCITGFLVLLLEQELLRE